jgi:hypothetical protein
MEQWLFRGCSASIIDGFVECTAEMALSDMICIDVSRRSFHISSDVKVTGSTILEAAVLVVLNGVNL